MFIYSASMGCWVPPSTPSVRLLSSLYQAAFLLIVQTSGFRCCIALAGQEKYRVSLS